MEFRDLTTEMVMLKFGNPALGVFNGVLWAQSSMQKNRDISALIYNTYIISIEAF